ncbi:DMT family transporter [Caenimonas aquaedulcis]|uniref:DMT family transporter n=1 Tax=Caenimonas aquaedulcis TaxID=2793270 RepID=A0A931MHT6_9BURK|nr:DMT family transporter [Caenimonas aquaedulcis]MBG9389148.1 DMT family transporter [Caenimonas aquaedulcis]
MGPSDRGAAPAASVLLPSLALVVNAFVWGISWWPFRQLQGHGLHPLWATAFIYFVSIALLLIVRPRAWRGFAGQPVLWLLMAAAGLTNVGFNWAVTVGDVVRVVLLFYLMPAWTVILAWPILGERPTAASLLRLAIALAGVVIVLKTDGARWPVPESAADWLSLAGSFSFALTNILLRKLGGSHPETRILAMFGGGAVLASAAGLLGMASGIVPAPPAPDMAWAGVGLALSLGFLVSNVALQYGASRIDAHAAALIMLSEVVFASLSSVALGAAELSMRTLAGGALILAAAVWSAWAGAK